MKHLTSPFLQGRALLNAIGNLELTGAYAEALKKLGHSLEDVDREVRCLRDDSIIYGFFFLFIIGNSY